MNIPFCLLIADSIQFIREYNFNPIMNFLNSNINYGIVGFKLQKYPTWRGTIDLIPGESFFS